MAKADNIDTMHQGFFFGAFATLRRLTFGSDFICLDLSPIQSNSYAKITSSFLNEAIVRKGAFFVEKFSVENPYCQIARDKYNDSVICFALIEVIPCR